MQTGNKKDILKQIKQFHRLYSENLEGKNFLIIYKRLEETKKVKLFFSKENFFHLTGLGQGKNILTPLKFYKKIEKSRLVTDDFEIKNFTLKKLSVSSEMIKIFTEKSRISDYDPKNKYQKNLSIDKGMALSMPQSKAVLGIRYIENDNSVPVSLLQQRLENISSKDSITDIICLLKKSFEEEKYSEIVYNTVDIKLLIESDKELESLLSDEILKKIEIK